MPATLHPHDGDIDRAYNDLLPVVQEVLQMPDMGPQSGDRREKDALLRNPLDADFHQLVEDNELRQAWIRAMMECGTAEGAPRIRANEEVPDYDYNYNMAEDRINVALPKNKLCHPKMRFIRKPSHTKAVHALLRAGYFPTIVTHSHANDKFKQFDNIPVCKYEYAIHYLDAEGLTTVHKLARYSNKCSCPIRSLNHYLHTQANTIVPVLWKIHDQMWTTS